MKFGIKRPLLHYVIIFGYILAPFINVLIYVRTYHISPGALAQNFFAMFGTTSGSLLLIEPIVGLSLFFIHRYSWYAFVVHGILVLLDNCIKLLTQSDVYQLGIFLSSATLLAVIYYALQKDFRAPYFQILPRSWRERRRVPIHHYVDLAGMKYEMSDFSETGCFIRDTASTLNLGDTVPVSFTMENEKIHLNCTGEVVRRDDQGFGIRFDGIPAAENRHIKQFLKQKFTLRYLVQHEAIWLGQHESKQNITIVDISSDGCYIAADTSAMRPGQTGTLRFSLAGAECAINCTIVWLNRGNFIKPLGAGIEFTAPQARLMRRWHRLKPNLELTR